MEFFIMLRGIHHSSLIAIINLHAPNARLKDTSILTQHHEIRASPNLKHPPTTLPHQLRHILRHAPNGLRKTTPAKPHQIPNALI